MATEYPNIYYEELAKLVKPSTSLSLKQGEVCFYEGKAKSYQVVTEIKATPKKKTSFFWTPWFAGIKRKTDTQLSQETKTDYYKGTFYITNMRLVFKCAVDAFDLFIPNVSTIKQYRDGIRVISGNRSFDVMTKEVTEILRIFELMNKAQEEPAKSSSISGATTKNRATSTRNTHAHIDEYTQEDDRNADAQIKRLNDAREQYEKTEEYDKLIAVYEDVFSEPTPWNAASHKFSLVGYYQKCELWDKAWALLNAILMDYPDEVCRVRRAQYRQLKTEKKYNEALKMYFLYKYNDCKAITCWADVKEREYNSFLKEAQSLAKKAKLDINSVTELADIFVELVEAPRSSEGTASRKFKEWYGMLTK